MPRRTTKKGLKPAVCVTSGPLSIYNPHTTTLRYILDSTNGGQKNSGVTGPRYLHKAVLVQGGGGGTLPGCSQLPE